jgi:hypothetical protein
MQPIIINFSLVLSSLLRPKMVEIVQLDKHTQALWFQSLYCSMSAERGINYQKRRPLLVYGTVNTP